MSGEMGGVGIFRSLAYFAFATLACAVVWLGGLNQDEGWYLYAAQLVDEGKLPYRDFFYTQGPLMPIIYSSFTFVWREAGLLGARIATCVIGLAGVAVFSALARLLVPKERRGAASVGVFLLLACNIYHLYYVSMPKTYAVASFFVAAGFYLVARAVLGEKTRPVLLFFGGIALAFAAGARISLGMLLAVAGFSLLGAFGRYRLAFFWFGLGGVLGLLAVYGPFVLDSAAFAGLMKAQHYHLSRGGGFSPFYFTGSISRLVRWYVPIFVVSGFAILGLRRVADGARETPGRRFMLGMFIAAAVAVFAVQMLAPFPYEDYQVPVMGLLAVAGVVLALTRQRQDGTPVDARSFLLLALGLSFASTFGSPLLEKWTTNGQDRFWTLKKGRTELSQLRDVARRIEAIDPGGKTLLTQDIYLAVETGRRVPDGLEMGPFSELPVERWCDLLSSAPCPVAALSGYTFAVNPPVCDERDEKEQMFFWWLLKRNYEPVGKEEFFGQNATTLVLLKRKVSAETGGDGKEAPAK